MIPQTRWVKYLGYNYDGFEFEIDTVDDAFVYAVRRRVLLAFAS